MIVRRTGASIVLSSTWRREASKVAIVNEMLKRRRLSPLWDHTRNFPENGLRRVPREAEICEWLDRHPEVTRWIAIDDLDLSNAATEQSQRMQGHFVKTSSSSGLNPHNAELAVRLMAEQNSYPQMRNRLSHLAQRFSSARQVPPMSGFGTLGAVRPVSEPIMQNSHVKMLLRRLDQQPHCPRASFSGYGHTSMLVSVR